MKRSVISISAKVKVKVTLRQDLLATNVSFVMHDRQK